jgi:hypothetical protein
VGCRSHPSEAWIDGIRKKASGKIEKRVDRGPRARRSEKPSDEDCRV